MKQEILYTFTPHELKGFFMGTDGEMYRDAKVSKNRFFGIRKLKKQKGNRWKINGVWWGYNQLMSHIK